MSRFRFDLKLAFLIVTNVCVIVWGLREKHPHAGAREQQSLPGNHEPLTTSERVSSRPSAFGVTGREAPDTVESVTVHRLPS